MVPHEISQVANSIGSASSMAANSQIEFIMEDSIANGQLQFVLEEPSQNIHIVQQGVHDEIYRNLLQNHL